MNSFDRLPSPPARWATPRSDRRSYGPAVARLSDVLGYPPMPWQREVLDVALEVDARGAYAYRTVVVTVPRQAGKTTLVTPMIAHRCLTGVDRLAWMTAQTRQDARDSFMQAAKVLMRSPLASRLALRRSNGSEELSFPTGSTYRIFAPVEDALHGKTNHLVVLDEAWSFDELIGAALMQAIIPTFATTGGQLWIISAAGTDQSAWFREFVEAGRMAVQLGQTSGLAFFEWSIPDHVDALDIDAVLAAHPARGITLHRDAVEQAASNLQPGEFARAYGNRWTSAAERVIPHVAWRDVCTSEVAELPGRGQLAIGFDVDIDENAAAIVGAWADESGQPRAELIDARPGAAWVPDRLDELDRKYRPGMILYDGMSPAAVLAPALTRLSLPNRPLVSSEYASACAALLRRVQNGTITVTGNPALDASVDAAARRNIGDRWGWNRRASMSSSAPLVALTLALWAHEEMPPPFEMR
jgi:hypothetical protein